MSIPGNCKPLNDKFQVKHYHIKQNSQGFFLSEKHCCPSIPVSTLYKAP
jgi:hypothetical protein